MTHSIQGLRQVRPHDLVVEFSKELAIARALGAGKPLGAYIGWTGQGNLGDEVLYEAHQVLFPDLSLVPYRPDFTAKYARKFRSNLPTYLAGFLGGGTLINQSQTWLNRILDLQNRGLPVACLGAGVTPQEFQLSFEHTNLTQWIPALRKFTFLGVRGPHSQALLANAGLEVAITGDPVLALAPQNIPAIKTNGVIGINLGVSAKTLMFGEPQQFLDNMVRIIKLLIKMDYQIRLMPVCDSDMASNTHVLETIDNPGCTLVKAYESFDTYTEQTKNCHLFMGQKLHATVLAVTQRIPSVMLAYQPKCDDFMASIGQDRNSVRTSEITPESVIEKIMQLENTHAQERSNLDAQVIRLRTKQREVANQVAQGFLEGSCR